MIMIPRVVAQPGESDVLEDTVTATLASAAAITNIFACLSRLTDERSRGPIIVSNDSTLKRERLKLATKRETDFTWPLRPGLD